jgi:hypothetical protein
VETLKLTLNQASNFPASVGVNILPDGQTVGGLTLTCELDQGTVNLRAVGAHSAECLRWVSGMNLFKTSYPMTKGLLDGEVGRL